MVKCNQLCEWNHYKHGCSKPLHVECPSETVLGNAGVANENPMTNGDRVRAMSDEELAALIYNGISSDPCDYCENGGYCDGAPCKGKDSEEIIANWLKQPAEEGK